MVTRIRPRKRTSWSVNTQNKLSSDKRSAAADQKKDEFDIHVHAGSQVILDVLSTAQKCESGGSSSGAVKLECGYPLPFVVYRHHTHRQCNR